MVSEEGSAGFGEELDPPAVQLHDDGAVSPCPGRGPACFLRGKSRKVFDHHQYPYCCACVYAEEWGEGSYFAFRSVHLLHKEKRNC